MVINKENEKFYVVNKKSLLYCKNRSLQKNFLSFYFIRTISFYIDNKINTF